MTKPAPLTSGSALIVTPDSSWIVSPAQLAEKRAADEAECDELLAVLRAALDDAGLSPVEVGAVIRLRDELRRLARISKADFESCARRAAEVSR